MDFGAPEVTNSRKTRGSREEREAEDKWLDEAIEESFPASDPLPTTGTFAGAPDDRPAKPSPKTRAQKRPD